MLSWCTHLSYRYKNKLKKNPYVELKLENLEM